MSPMEAVKFIGAGEFIYRPGDEAALHVWLESLYGVVCKEHGFELSGGWLWGYFTREQWPGNIVAVEPWHDFYSRVPEPPFHYVRGKHG